MIPGKNYERLPCLNLMSLIHSILRICHFSDFTCTDLIKVLSKQMCQNGQQVFEYSDLRFKSWMSVAAAELDNKFGCRHYSYVRTRLKQDQPVLRAMNFLSHLVIKVEFLTKLQLSRRTATSYVFLLYFNSVILVKSCYRLTTCTVQYIMQTL